MGQTQKLCQCTPKNLTTTNEGEIICKCGFMWGEDHDNTSSINSKTNLAQDFQLGGKRTGSFISEKFINSHTDLSTISNICQGLSLPSFIYHDVWKWYQKLNPLLIMTKSKTMFFVIYILCRYNGLPLDEAELQKRIQINLHVKSSSNSLKIISKAFSLMSKDGMPIIEEIGFAKFIGNTNCNFLLLSKLKLLEEKYPIDLVTQIRHMCFEILPQFPNNPQSVRKAIKIAMQRCGIC